MYVLNRIWNFGLILSIFLISCESKNDNYPVFSIEFQDGTIINEEDISFYDSSACILFLKAKIYLDYGSEGYPLDADFFDFSVFVNNDIVFQGIIFPDYNYNVTPQYTFISSKTYPDFESEILPFRFWRSCLGMNDPRIIESLDKSNLLRHGITCSVDNVKLSPEDEFSAICIFLTKTDTDSWPFRTVIPAQSGH